MNLYEWPTANPAPKPTRHWGLDKSYKIVDLTWSYEFVQISHLVKYARIGHEIALVELNLFEFNWNALTESRWQSMTSYPVMLKA